MGHGAGLDEVTRKESHSFCRESISCHPAHSIQLSVLAVNVESFGNESDLNKDILFRELVSNFFFTWETNNLPHNPQTGGQG
jgi:hypothetical protein